MVGLDLIILELTFIEARAPATRLALLKDINTRVAGEAKISPDDLMIEAPGVNFSFGQAEAKRVKVVAYDPMGRPAKSKDAKDEAN